jgi:drug/metabolite transporter (DMT)-like permease
MATTHPLGITLGVLASVLWALSSLFATRAVRSFGSLYYNCLRLLAGTSLLALIAFGLGDLRTPSLEHLAIIAGSSLLGLTIGDLLLFRGFAVLGPRRATLIFMLNIPMTGVIGLFFLGEQFSWQQVFGTALAIAGVALATAVRPTTPPLQNPLDSDLPPQVSNPAPQSCADKTSRARLDDLQGTMRSGILTCLLAALCQAIGLVMLRPIAAENIYSMPQLSMMRFGVAAIFAVIMLQHREKGTGNAGLGPILRADKTIVLSVAGAVLSGSVLGFICYTGALAYLPAAMAALVTSLSPIFVLPMLVVYARQWPPLRAWAGACVGCMGIAMTVFPF